jgi:hypothetical protein
MLELKDYVNGRWEDARSGGRFDVVNPATGETIATAPDSAPPESGRLSAGCAGGRRMSPIAPHPITPSSPMPSHHTHVGTSGPGVGVGTGTRLNPGWPPSMDRSIAHRGRPRVELQRREPHATRPAPSPCACRI